MTYRPALIGPAILGLVLLAAGAGSAWAAAPCAGVDTGLTDARRAAYAPLIADAMAAEVAPSEVVIHHFLAAGGWIVVGAEVPVADGEGFFFFEKIGDKLHSRDTWAGFADPSGAGEIAGWARGLGAPDALARCFAQAATD